MYMFMPCTIDTTAIRNVTPMSTPISEKKLLSFCARIVWSARRTASSQGIRPPRPAVDAVALHLAVAQHHDALGVRRDVGLVGHHDDRLALARAARSNTRMISSLVVLSRLPVGSSARRIDGLVDQRARDGDALPLAARQLVGAVVHAVAQAHPLERRAGARRAAPGADTPA